MKLKASEGTKQVWGFLWECLMISTWKSGSMILTKVTSIAVFGPLEGRGLKSRSNWLLEMTLMKRLFPQVSFYEWHGAKKYRIRLLFDWFKHRFLHTRRQSKSLFNRSCRMSRKWLLQKRSNSGKLQTSVHLASNLNFVVMPSFDFESAIMESNNCLKLKKFVVDSSGRALVP